MNWSQAVRYDLTGEIIDNVKSEETLNEEDNKGLIYSILNSALECGRKDVAEFLLNKPNCTVMPVKRSPSLQNTPLHNAVILEDLRIVDILLEKGASVFICNAENNTPLHLAFFKNNTEILDSLLAAIERSCNHPNMRNKLGLTFLHIACTRNNVNVINKLCKSNADLKDVVSDESKMWKGFTSLHFAAEYRSLDALKILTKKLASSRVDLECKNGNGHTALQIINKHMGDLLVMSDLLSLDTNSNSFKSISNFHIACARDDPAFVEKFLDKGASINGPVSTKANVCPKYSPIHFATESGKQDNVKMLVEQGADLNRCNYDDMTPLHLALYYEKWGKRSPLVDFLYKATKNKEANPKDLHNLNYLHVASTRNDVDLVNKLLDKNVDINSKVTYREKEFYDFTPLHFATVYENLEVAELLIRRGADVHVCAIGPISGTPFHIALNQGNKHLIKLLLANGSNPKLIRPYDQLGALNLLVYGYTTKKDQDLLPYIEKLIMEFNVDVNAEDHDGDTALHIATEGFSVTTPVIKLLLDFGADINVENNGGETPFTYVMKKENYEKYNKNADYMLFYHHVQKLKAFGLRVSEKNQKCCDTMRDKRGIWTPDFKKFIGEGLTTMENKRQEEITRMKKLEIVLDLTLYDFVMLEPEAAAVYNGDEFSGFNLITTVSSLIPEFPIYGNLVKLQLHKIGLITQNVDVEQPHAKRQRSSE